MIDYENFLSERFDLVLRWHFLEKSGFDIRKAKALIMSNEYKYLRDLLTRMMPIMDRDAADWASYFFRPVGNWLWIEDRMKEGENWIKSDPYIVRIGGIGTSTKRFILALEHERKLYWAFKRKKSLRTIWKEGYYKELLHIKKYRIFKNVKKGMISKMEKLAFFSIGDYVGNARILGKYLSEKKIGIG